jgi:hypothetical protein
MAKITRQFGSGGANVAPGGSAGQPALADVLRDLADDLTALKPQRIAAADATAAYGAGEQALLNQLKAPVNALAAVVLKTTKG